MKAIMKVKLNKKWFALILVALAMVLLPCHTHAQDFKRLVKTTTIRGDANNDGLINMSDVTFVINCILNNNGDTYQLENVDVNGDGYINMSDVTIIINIILGKPAEDNDDNEESVPVDDDDANPGLPVLLPMP